MAPRASWKGYIKLSLVSCPVRLYPAVSAGEKISFNQLHKDTHNRINMKPVDPELGLVERSDLVRGYEYEDKQYIIVEDSDLEAVRIEHRTRSRCRCSGGLTLEGVVTVVVTIGGFGLLLLLVRTGRKRRAGPG